MKIIPTAQVLRDIAGNLVEKFYRWRLTRRLIEIIASVILVRRAQSKIEALQDNLQRTDADNDRLDSLYQIYLELMEVGAGKRSLVDVLREYGQQDAPARDEEVSLHVTMKGLTEYMK